MKTPLPYLTGLICLTAAIPARAAPPRLQKNSYGATQLIVNEKPVSREAATQLTAFGATALQIPQYFVLRL